MPISPLVKQLARRTGVLFLVYLAALIVPDLVDFPARYEARIDHAFTWVAAIALFFQVAIWANVAIAYASARYIARHGTDPGDAMTIRTVAVLVKVMVWGVIAINVVWAFFQTNLTGLVAGLGVGGIAIAFALQNILADLFGALSIVLDRPFVLGDAIQVDGLSGRVERIGLKSTRVRADTGEQIVFGNGDLLKGRIRNFGRMEERQTVLVTRVAGSTPADKLARIPATLRDIVQERPGTRFVRAALTAIDESGIDFTTVYYLTSPSYQLFVDTRQAVLLEIVRRFERDGVRLTAQLESAAKEKTAGLPAIDTPPANAAVNS